MTIPTPNAMRRIDDPVRLLVALGNVKAAAAAGVLTRTQTEALVEAADEAAGRMAPPPKCRNCDAPAVVDGRCQPCSDRRRDVLSRNGLLLGVA